MKLKGWLENNPFLTLLFLSLFLSLISMLLQILYILQYYSWCVESSSELQDIIATLGMDDLTEDDKFTVSRACYHRESCCAEVQRKFRFLRRIETLIPSC